MPKKLIPLLLLAGLAFCQNRSAVVNVTSDPSGACSPSNRPADPIEYNITNGSMWGCKAHVWTLITGAGGGGSVTTISGSGPSWLTWTIANPTTTPAITLAATTGQSSHQVIGTCNALTAFAPCALVAGDLPSTAVTPGSYTSANLTVDQQGRITAAASGGGGSSVATPRHIQSVTARGNTVGTLAYRSSVASGSCLVVGIGWEAGANTNASITDTLTTTWTRQEQLTGNANQNCALFTGTTSSSGADTITLTLPAGAGFNGIHASEFDGATCSTTTLDTSGGVRDGNLTITTTQAGDLIYWLAQGVASAGSFTVPVGFPTGLPSSGSDSGQITYLFQESSSGLTDLTGINSSNNTHWAYCAIALKHP